MKGEVQLTPKRLENPKEKLIKHIHEMILEQKIVEKLESDKNISCEERSSS
jgi:hypothetical protein